MEGYTQYVPVLICWYLVRLTKMLWTATLLGIALKRRISLKPLHASVPSLSICTGDIMQDIPLRSEYEQTIGLEKLGTNLPHIFNTIAFTSPLEGVKLLIDSNCILF